MRRAGRRLAVAVGSILTMLAFAMPAPAQADAAPSCQEVDVPVTLGLLVRTTMHGKLCKPAGATPSTVFVLVPGGTYNSSYWDFPWNADTYNFREAMNEAGYATFTLDRLGTGKSGRLLSVLATTTAQARLCLSNFKLKTKQ